MKDKLLKIQAALHAPKGQTNKFGGYKYRSCEDILEAVKPLCVEHGCVLLVTDEVIEVGGRVYVRATATLADPETPLHKDDVTIQVCGWAREEGDRKGMSASQITGSASSYARKYALNGLFCIDDTKDADATNDHGKKPKPKAKAKPKKKAAPIANPDTAPVHGVEALKEEILTDYNEYMHYCGMIPDKEMVPLPDDWQKLPHEEMVALQDRVRTGRRNVKTQVAMEGGSDA